jgi:hypothetical protein
MTQGEGLPDAGCRLRWLRVYIHFIPLSFIELAEKAAGLQSGQKLAAVSGHNRFALR